MTEQYGQAGYTDSISGEWTPFNDAPSNEGKYPRDTTVAELALINTPFNGRYSYDWDQIPGIEHATRGSLVRFNLGPNTIFGRIIDHHSNGIFLSTTVRVQSIGDITVGGDAPEENPTCVARARNS